MADDGEIRINTKIDNTGVEKGLKDLKDKVDNAGKSLEKGTKANKGFADGLKSIATSSVGAVAGVTAAAAAIKKTVEALDECAAAYRVQVKAEKSLEIAAKNNPYLNSESVYNLKKFAGELQNISEIGDETSLQVMAELAATGRTQEQIIEIMNAAANMAAVTGQDISSAAQQLSATLNGSAGALARTNSAIAALTKEELENGKAIKLVSNQYKDAANETASIEAKLSNAWGDFKETIGAGWQTVTQPVKQFMLETLQQINEINSKTEELNEALAAKAQGNANIIQQQLIVDNARNNLELAQQGLERLIENQNRARGSITETTLNNQRNLIRQRQTELNTALQDLQRTQEQAAKMEGQIQEQNRQRELQRQREQQQQQQQQQQAERDDEATRKILANTQALQAQIKALELKAKIEGKEVSAQDIYNAYLNSYIDLIANSNNLISENNIAAKKRKELLDEWAKKAKEAKTQEELLADALELQNNAIKYAEEIENDNKQKGKSQYKRKQEEIENYRKTIEDIEDKEILEAKRKKELLKALDKEYADNKKELWREMTEEINAQTQQVAQVTQDATNLMLQAVQQETDLELAALEKKYTAGEIAEEDYYTKQKEIKRKAAQEEYKIKMFEWSASILAATANIAEGVSKAIAQGGLAGLVSGALVGAAGAVQIASIIASKPIPPQFASGGVIGGIKGASMGGDNTYIHARAGEMVLNANQQRSLWDKINGQDSRQQAGLNLIVNNTQSDRVDADIKQANGALYIDIIDKHINRNINNGTYDAGFAGMNLRQQGVRIL